MFFSCSSYSCVRGKEEGTLLLSVVDVVALLFLPSLVCIVFCSFFTLFSGEKVFQVDYLTTGLLLCSGSTRCGDELVAFTLQATDCPLLSAVAGCWSPLLDMAAVLPFAIPTWYHPPPTVFFGFD